MNEEKVKIMAAVYDAGKSMAKIKVLKIDENKEVTWAMLGDDFDSLIAQITGISFKFSDEQRLTICDKLDDIEFLNRIEFDVDNTEIEKSKDKNLFELQHEHDAVDKYPFYEIQLEAIEEVIHGTQQEKDES